MCDDDDDDDDDCDGFKLALWRWRLLFLLRDHPDAEKMFSSGEGSALFADRRRLECFLCAGDCAANSGSSPKSAGERWYNATQILLKLMACDGDRLAKSGTYFRIAVAVALTFGSGGRYGSMDPVKRYEAYSK